MMMMVAALLGGIGLVCMLVRKTILGFLIGIQLLVLGATTTFVFVGSASGVLGQGQVFGFFIILSSVSQLIVGFAIAIRLFYLRKRTDLEGLNTLRH